VYRHYVRNGVCIHIAVYSRAGRSRKIDGRERQAVYDRPARGRVAQAICIDAIGKYQRIGKGSGASPPLLSLIAERKRTDYRSGIIHKPCAVGRFVGTGSYATQRTFRNAGIAVAIGIARSTRAAVSFILIVYCSGAGTCFLYFPSGRQVGAIRIGGIQAVEVLQVTKGGTCYGNLRYSYKTR